MVSTSLPESWLSKHKFWLSCSSLKLCDCWVGKADNFIRLIDSALSSSKAFLDVYPGCQNWMHLTKYYASIPITELRVSLNEWSASESRNYATPLQWYKSKFSLIFLLIFVFIFCLNSMKLELSIISFLQGKISLRYLVNHPHLSH